MKDTVLVVEDEGDVADLLRYNLSRAGFNVLVANAGDAGLAMAREYRPAVIVLDIMLPGLSGYQVCRSLKSSQDTEAIPVVMLTAKGEPQERVKGLELGADDYVTKPFSPRELVLRVQALLRRAKTASREEVIRIDGLSLNKPAFEVQKNGHRIDLTTIEFKLFCLLVERRGSVLSREILLREVWGYAATMDSRTVDTHMRRLREKLGEYAGRLETVRGEGYRFSAVAAP